MRRVPLFGIALEAARWWLPRAGVVFFPTVRGYHRPKSRIVDADDWKAWLATAKIGRLRWHDLRHTCATLLLRGDLSDHAWSTDAVRDMLGHSTVRVTERYAKPDGALAEAASRRQRQANAEPTAGGAEIAKALEILGRCGWDLNPRVPVLQTGA